MLRLVEDTPSIQFFLQIQTDGKLRAGFITGATVTSTRVFGTNTWRRVNIMVDFAAKKAWVKVDGVKWMSGIATEGGYECTGAVIGCAATGVPESDMTVHSTYHYLCSNTGSDNNSEPGTVAVLPMAPNAQGTHDDFTGVGELVNKYLNWDEIAVNAADYNYSAYAGGAEEQTSNLAASAVPTGHEMLAVKVLACWTYSIAAPNGYLMLRDSGTDSQHDMGVLTAGQRIDGSYWGSRPAGGDWTAAALDALEAGTAKAAENGYEMVYACHAAHISQIPPPRRRGHIL